MRSPPGSEGQNIVDPRLRGGDNYTQRPGHHRRHSRPRVVPAKAGTQGVNSSGKPPTDYRIETEA